MKRLLLALAILMYSYSLPAWAGGNWQCTFTEIDGKQFFGTAPNTSDACWNAAYGTNEFDGACQYFIGIIAPTLHPPVLNAVCEPDPFVKGLLGNAGPSQVCVDGSCAGGNSAMCYSLSTDNPANPFCHTTGSPTANVQQLTSGTNWGPQFGSDHTYDSAASSTPDVIQYYGPEDGNISIVIDADNGAVNSTQVTAVSLTNVTFGNSTGTVTHVTGTNTNYWVVSGQAVATRQYNLNITFSHTGSYGQYTVRFSTVASRGSRYTPIMSFCPNFTNCSSSGITYSVQSATYQIIGNKVLVDLYVQLTSKGTQTGYVEMTLPIPEAYPFSVACSGGGVDTSDFGALIVDVCSNSAQFQYSGGLFLDNTTVNNNSFFRATFMYDWQ